MVVAACLLHVALASEPFAVGASAVAFVVEQSLVVVVVDRCWIEWRLWIRQLVDHSYLLSSSGLVEQRLFVFGVGG